MTYGFYDILQLLGALGLFLFGMKVMSDALLKLAGNRLRTILASMTSNRVFGVITGFFITSVIQSSSATTLMVVSFSNAGLLTLVESISVIMGANIGTTITAWLITILGFKVSMSAIALPLVGVGFLFTFSKKKNFENWGNFIVGFAILFIGLQFLKDAMPDINSNPEILEFLKQYTDLGFGSVLLFLLIGTILTVVIQSSSATMALTLIMTAEGWIPFELAAAMVLGENIGTTITANLAAMVATYKAKRTARAHLVFNIIGVIWVLILFYPFLKLIGWLSERFGAESPFIVAAAIPVAISLFHTVFNIANTILLIWFIGPIAKLVERIIPEVTEPELQVDQPKFLNKSVLKYPETVISALKEESQHLFENTIFEIVAHALNVSQTDILSEVKMKTVIKKSKTPIDIDIREQYMTRVKSIYGQVINYATRAQTDLDLNASQTQQMSEIKVANRTIVEIIKDVSDLSKNISLYLNSENKHIRKEYNKLRKRVAKVLRIIYLFRTEEDNAMYYKSLLAIKAEAKANKFSDNIQLDTIIRNDQITVDMASSLVNDTDNVNDIIKNLISVAALLYGKQDPLLENGN